jgi:hypothetical protein
MPSSLVFSAAYGSLGDVAPILAVAKEVLVFNLGPFLN